MSFSDEFVKFYEQVKQNSVFNHALYTKNGCAVGMLTVQEYYYRLLDGTFLDEYRVVNKSIIKNYSNVERIQAVKENDLYLAITAYKPMQWKALTLPSYILSHERYSRLVDDILNPGFVANKEHLAALYPNETAIMEGIALMEMREGAVYRWFIGEMGFKDCIATKKKMLALYEWWKPYRRIVYHFSDTNKNYQQTFNCLLDYYIEYFNSWDNRDMVYNVFGIVSGKIFEKFLAYCTDNGYHLIYDPHSWCLPWNKRIQEE